MQHVIISIFMQSIFTLPEQIEIHKCYADKQNNNNKNTNRLFQPPGYWWLFHQHDANLVDLVTCPQTFCPPSGKEMPTRRSDDTRNISSLTLHDFDFFSQRHPQPFGRGMGQELSCAFIARDIRNAVFRFCFILLRTKVRTIKPPFCLTLEKLIFRVCS